MLGMATGRYTILRGSTAANDYGDEVDSHAIAHTDVLGSVVEKSRKVFDPASSRVVTLRYLAGRFRYGTDVQDGDRIQDQKTGDTYVVSAVHKPTNVAVKSDVVVDLTEN